jgi:hypothetical protein
MPSINRDDESLAPEAIQNTAFSWKDNALIESGRLGWQALKNESETAPDV